MVSVIRFVSGNPIVEGAKADMRKWVYGNGLEVRTLARKLGWSEDTMYLWLGPNSKAGNPRLDRLLKLMETCGGHIGDGWVLSNRRGRRYKVPNALSSELCYLAGLIAGDGDLEAKHGTIRLTSADDDLLNDFSALVSTIFGINTTSYHRESNGRAATARGHCAGAIGIFNALGVPCSPKSHIIDPNRELMPIGSEMALSFIRGIMDTDGYIYGRTHGIAVGVTTTSPMLHKYIADNFDAIGIGYSTWVRQPKTTKLKSGHLIVGRHETHCIDFFSRGSIEKYASIGFGCERKNKILEAFLDGR